MEFIETPTFTRQVLLLMSDDDYAKQQSRLQENPEAGDLVGGGGIRKLRVSLTGKGKSGGARFIYYWLRDDSQIYMLLAYPKSEKDDLTARETAVLRKLVKELCNG